MLIFLSLPACLCVWWYSFRGYVLFLFHSEHGDTVCFLINPARSLDMQDGCLPACTGLVWRSTTQRTQWIRKSNLGSSRIESVARGVIRLEVATKRERALTAVQRMLATHRSPLFKPFVSSVQARIKMSKPSRLSWIKYMGIKLTSILYELLLRFLFSSFYLSFFFTHVFRHWIHFIFLRFIFLLYYGIFWVTRYKISNVKGF